MKLELEHNLLGATVKSRWHYFIHYTVSIREQFGSSPWLLAVVFCSSLGLAELMRAGHLDDSVIGDTRGFAFSLSLLTCMERPCEDTWEK